MRTATRSVRPVASLPAPDARSVLIVGIAPEAVDLTDPSLPPGLTADEIRKGLENAQAQIAAAGDHADLCLIQPDSCDGAGLDQLRYFLQFLAGLFNPFICNCFKGLRRRLAKGSQRANRQYQNQ